MATKKKAPAGRIPSRKPGGGKAGGGKAAGGKAGSKPSAWRPGGGMPGGAKPGGRKPAARKPGQRQAFKASAPRGGQAGRGPERKLPRKYGPRRKTPRSIGREAAPPAAAPSPAGPDESRPLALLVAQAALEKKAEAVTVYDVRDLSSYANYLVIMTTDSDRQAGAVADNIDAVLKAAGHTKVAVEGYETGTWVIVDYGDVVAHVMAKASREFYDLDGLWADAPRFTADA
jgi:ribosome-associated protein